MWERLAVGGAESPVMVSVVEEAHIAVWPSRLAVRMAVE